MFYFCLLPCTCEETCESVWSPNVSLYATALQLISPGLIELPSIMVGGFKQKMEKKLFFAVQIEKTEINILQKKMGEKAFLL